MSVQSVRLQVSFPQELAERLSSLVKRGERSRFIADAVSRIMEESTHRKKRWVFDERFMVTREERLFMTGNYAPVNADA